MGVVQLQDTLLRAIEQQVAEGRAANPAAFLEEAVMRLIDESSAEEEAVRHAVETGSADIEAGRYVLVTNTEDAQHMVERLMARLQVRLAADQ